MKCALAALLLCACTHAPASERRARDVTITRDDWGIAHVHGKTDADAVYGMIYAQAEDDFARIELNYLEAMGRRSELEGDKALWRDVRRRLFFDEQQTRALYDKCEPWLRELMDAWADGLNAYLAKHPVARVIKHFEPWMALAFTEGSIGDDVESNVRLDALAALYGGAAEQPAKPQGGSNGIAIAPQNTTAKHALLLINPHTTHYFRSELQMTSDEGLDVYGAVTWGQFFVYQGFNERLGFMHTSSSVDTVDELYEEHPRSESLTIGKRTLTILRGEHGPVVRRENGKLISLAVMQRPIEALSESFLRTKARTLAEFEKTLALHGNSSNDTVYADADGHIAYFRPSFVAKRDPRFDWTKPVANSWWQGIHELSESPHVVDPHSGWIVNTNNWPWSVAGPQDSPRAADFAKYWDVDGENLRALHAQQLVAGRADFSLDELIRAAFDPRLPAFEQLVPLLQATSAPAAELKSWDKRWSQDSVATTLAVAWGEELARMQKGQRGSVAWIEAVKAHLTAEQLAQALDAAVARLTAAFGTWKIPWGEVNRFQRVSDDVEQKFDDALPSIPIPFTSSQWGSLAADEARAWGKPELPAKKRYGVSGNSFVAAIEFTPEGPHARAITAGGESGDKTSPHFRDQAERFATGRLRDVYFTPAQLAGHVERTYRP